MEGERVRAQQSYEEMLVDGLTLSDKAAAEHGIGEIYEDIIDSGWAAVPTEKKVKLKVLTPSGLRSAILEWQAACEIQPPDGTPYQERVRHPRRSSVHGGACPALACPSARRPRCSRGTPRRPPWRARRALL